jgi:hypothetical protein
MTRVSALVANLIADESGQELVEYTLVVAIMALATIATLLKSRPKHRDNLQRYRHSNSGCRMKVSCLSPKELRTP